jgi:hypothetical protein
MPGSWQKITIEIVEDKEVSLEISESFGFWRGCAKKELEIFSAQINTFCSSLINGST